MKAAVRPPVPRGRLAKAGVGRKARKDKVRRAKLTKVGGRVRRDREQLFTGHRESYDSSARKEPSRDRIRDPAGYYVVRCSGVSNDEIVAVVRAATPSRTKDATASVPGPLGSGQFRV